MAPHTIYLVGLNADDERSVREDFRVYPFPGWRLDVLAIGAAIPADVIAGQAILVVGCGQPDAVQYAEAMWLLRLLACGCPWVAVAHQPNRPTRARCEAAGAAAYLTRPFGPPTLRELIWRYAIRHTDTDTPSLSLTCGRLIRYLAAVGADVLLKFAGPDESAAFLAIRGGLPVGARLLDGPSGEAAFRTILDLRSGTVSGHALPENLEPDLASDSPAVAEAIASAPPTLSVIGGREACDRVVQEFPGIKACAVADLSSGRVVASPSQPLPHAEVSDSAIVAMAELFRPIDPTEAVEWADEVLVRFKDGWWAATWLRPGPFALTMEADTNVLLGLVRSVFEGAATEFGQPNRLVVADSANIPLEALATTSA